MINLFRHSNPISLLLLVVLACFSHFIFPFSNAHLNLPHHESMFQVQFNSISGGFLEKKSFWNGLASTIIVLAEAFGLNKIIGNLRLFEKSGFLPSLCFVLVTNLIPYPYQGQMLLVNGMLLLAMIYIISSFKKEKANGMIILSGFFVGVAAGMSNNLLFFPWLTIALFAMRPASFREWILSLIGFILPYYLMISTSYLTDRLELNTSLQLPQINAIIPEQDAITWIRLLGLLGLSALGLIFSGKLMGKMLIHARKTMIITYQLFFITLISCLIFLNQVPYVVLMMTIPASIMIIPLFIASKKQLLPNLLLMMIIILSILR